MEIALPAEVFARFKMASTAANATSADLDIAESCMFEAVQEAETQYQIRIGIFSKKVKLWVGDDTTLLTVWGKLEQVHGIKRARQKFSLGGQEVEDDRSVGEVRGLTVLCVRYMSSCS